MMEAATTSETSVNFYQATRRYNPEDSHLRTHHRGNIKSYLGKVLFIIVSCPRVTCVCGDSGGSVCPPLIIFKCQVDFRNNLFGYGRLIRHLYIDFNTAHKSCFSDLGNFCITTGRRYGEIACFINSLRSYLLRVLAGNFNEKVYTYEVAFIRN
jgi:hypothetical protein